MFTNSFTFLVDDGESKNVFSVLLIGSKEMLDDVRYIEKQTKAVEWIKSDTSHWKHWSITFRFKAGHWWQYKHTANPANVDTLAKILTANSRAIANCAANPLQILEAVHGQS